MSELKKIQDLQRLLAEAERPPLGHFAICGDLVGSRRALLKMKQFSVNEVLGYQLAKAIGVRVPRMQGIWPREAVDVPPDGRIAAFRIGIVIQYLDETSGVSWEDAAVRDADGTAKALLLCVFDRHEWGQFLAADNVLYFVDLERILPPMFPEELVGLSPEERREELEHFEKSYARGDLRAIREAFEVAKDLRLEHSLEEEARSFCRVPVGPLRAAVSITGHPLAPLISAFSARALANRRNVLAEWVEAPAHPLTDWGPLALVP